MITTTQPRPAGQRGFTTIELLVCLAIIGILMTFLLPSVQHARESARQMTCKFNLRQLMLATQSFESAHRRFPIGVSHKVELLPYLEQTAAHRVLASGNEAHNSPGLPNIFVEGFVCPSDAGRVASETLMDGIQYGSRCHGNAGTGARDVGIRLRFRGKCDASKT